MNIEKEVIERCMEVLEECKDSSGMWSAIETLGKIGGSAVPGLLKLLDSKDITKVKWACRGIERIGPLAKRAVPVLTRFLKDKDLRLFAVQALRSIGPAARKSLPLLIKILENGGDEKLRDETIFAIGRIKSRAGKSIPLLISALKDKSEKIRSGAAWTLGEVGISHKKLVITALIEALEDTNVRRNAVYALENFGSAAKKPLLGIIRSRSNSVVRAGAAEALSYIEPLNKEVVPALVKILGEKNRDSVCDAANCLGRKYGYRAREAVPALKKLLKSKNENIRRCVVSNLLKIDPSAKEAIKMLIDDLTSGNQYIRKFAVWDLCRFRPSTQYGQSAIHKILKGRNKEVKPAVACTYINIFPDYSSIAVVSLRDLLRDKDPLIREKTVEDVMTIKDREEIKKLMDLIKNLLRDTYPAVRKAAAFTLGELNEPAAVPVLGEILEGKYNADSKEENKAAALLSDMRDKSAIPILVKSLRNESSIVRKRVSFAIGNLGSESEVKSLLELRDDPYVSVMSAALYAIEAIKTIKNTPRKVVVKTEKARVKKCIDGKSEDIADVFKGDVLDVYGKLDRMYLVNSEAGFFKLQKGCIQWRHPKWTDGWISENFVEEYKGN